MTTHESKAAPFRRAGLRGNEHEVIARLERLGTQLDGEPDPAFRLATRQRLVAMAAVRTPEPVRPSPLRRLLAVRGTDGPAARWRTRATAGLAGAALTVTALATLVAFSAEAGPGDPLYGLKRGTEQTQLALAGDSRGQVLLDLARTRLEELSGLGDAALAESTLDTMDRQTTEGVEWLTDRAVGTQDTAPLDEVSGWAGEQSAQLSAAHAEVPAAAADDVDASLALLSEITTRVDALRVSLACPGGPATAGSDRLGPLPVGCPVVPASPQATGGPGVEGTVEPVPTTAAAPAQGTAPLPATPGPQPGGVVPGLPSVVPPAPTTTPPPLIQVPGSILPLPAPDPASPTKPLLDVGPLCVPPLLAVGNC